MAESFQISGLGCYLPAFAWRTRLNPSPYGISGGHSGSGGRVFPIFSVSSVRILLFIQFVFSFIEDCCHLICDPATERHIPEYVDSNT